MSSERFERNGSGAERIRCVIVDDQSIIRTGLRLIVDNEPDMIVVAEAGDGEEAVAMTTRWAPDVVLMDIRMPRMDGVRATREAIEAAERVGQRPPGVLVLTTFEDEAYLLGALRAGASGFLLKDARPAVILNAIRTVHRGDALVDPAVTRKLLSHWLSTDAGEYPQGTPVPRRRGTAVLRNFDQLSERERQVLFGLARGKSNRELAQDLGLVEATVKSHVSSVLSKLGVRSRVEAVVLAYESGLVVPGRQ